MLFHDPKSTLDRQAVRRLSYLCSAGNVDPSSQQDARMPQPGSITQLMLDTTDGDEDAAHDLWQRFRQRLTGLAQKKLKGTRKAVGDEEDVAIEAFHSFLRGARAGRYDLPTRDQIWQLLACIAMRRARAMSRQENATKRRGTLGESALKRGAGGEKSPPGIATLAADEPTPATIAELNLLLCELHELFDDELEGRILALKLEGYSHRQVAERLGVGLWRVRKTVKKIEQHLLK